MPASRIVALALAAAGLGLAACSVAPAAAKLPGSTAKVKVSSVEVDGGKQSVLVATALSDGARFFARPPFDLHGAWRVEATCGIYDADALAASSSAPFGIEVDLRGTGPTPTQYYALYATRTAAGLAGLQVSASSHGGLTFGTAFLTNATKADLVIESDGSTVFYRVREAGSAAAYATIGTRSLASPTLPHQAAFGMSGAKKGAKFGFTNFRIPVHGAAPTAPAPEQDALNSCYEAALAALDAAYAVDDPAAADAEVAAATLHVDRALAALDAARAKLDAIPDPGKTPPARRARKAVDAAAADMRKAKSAFEARGVAGIRPFLRSLAKTSFAAAFKATDALLPEAMRVALPGGSLSR